jgi:4-hydroxybutyryl-CoA dehydratase/vinylacetyl-CoA-Delta-isomerase
MGIRTREEYIESLRRQKPRVYMAGERIESIVDHPAFQPAINLIATTYDIENNPKYRDKAVVDKPIGNLVNEPISRYTQLAASPEELVEHVKLYFSHQDFSLPCCYRCFGHHAINSLWANSYDIDQKYHTEYHDRVIELVKRIQKEDLEVGAASVDPKGDRRFGLSGQQDLDMNLRVVEKKKDGIVVRGAKPHSTGAAYMNLLNVRGCTGGSEEEKDFAVAFCTPIDVPGITIICKPPPFPWSEPRQLEFPYSQKVGGHTECLVIFEDVFVPWENVYMCGEIEFAGPMSVMRAGYHAMHKCSCRGTLLKIAIGATQLLAEYNGLENSNVIYDTIADLVMEYHILQSCALSAALQAWRHDTGIYFAKVGPASSGKVYMTRQLGDERVKLLECAGGLASTKVSEKDYLNPETRGFIEKYYKGRNGIPTENRLRAFELIEDLTTSEFAGWYLGLESVGGTPIRTHKRGVMAEWDMEECKRMAKAAARIKE